MVNTLKRMDFVNKSNPNATAYTEILTGVHTAAVDKLKFLVFSKLRVTVKHNNITQTATTDTVEDFDTLAEALACMEKWRISREQNGTWESLITIDRTEAMQ